MEHNRFSIGEFKEIKDPSLDDIHGWIVEVERTPQLLRNTLHNFTEEEFEHTYKPGGWTVRQIVHHIADNNMNVYFRFKKTLTENRPVLPSYEQEKWAELEDYKEPIEVSLKLIESIYRRIVVLLKSMNSDQFKRTMTSSTYGVMSLETVIQRFLWHDRHHIAQINKIKNREQD